METPDLILLNVGVAIHYADWNYQNVNSPFARIYLVQEGRAWLHLPEKVQELTPGYLYIIPPFTLHSYECDDHFSLCYMHIYENQSSSDRILEDFIFPTAVEASFLDIQLVKQLYDMNPGRELKRYDPSDYDNSSTLFRTISSHAQAPLSSRFATKGILYLLCSRFLIEAMHKFEATDNRIRKALRYIRQHIDQPIGVDELSDLCCLSKDHFIRLFKKEMQLTPVQYINQKKIEKAQLKIITGNQSVKDIAYSLSFDNISYFNRLFKKHTGINPTQYRSK